MLEFETSQESDEHLCKIGNMLEDERMTEWANATNQDASDQLENLREAFIEYMDILESAN